MTHIVFWLGMLTIICGAAVMVYFAQQSRQFPKLKHLLLPGLFINLIVLSECLSGYVFQSFFTDRISYHQSFFINLMSPLVALLIILLVTFTIRWIWRGAGLSLPRTLQIVTGTSPYLLILFYSIYQLFYRDAGHGWHSMLSYDLILLNVSLLWIILSVWTARIWIKSYSEQVRVMGLFCLWYALGLTVMIANKILKFNFHGLLNTSLAMTYNLYPLIWLPYFRRIHETQPQSIRLDPAEIFQISKKLGFSNRQQEILPLLLEGKNNREIAEQLFIAPHTVKNHIYRLYRHLGIKNRMELLNVVLEKRCEAGSVIG